MKVLVIDNYDSFVYNLVHYLEALDADVVVKRNDEVSIQEIDSFDKILISPGPGLPKEAGIVIEVIEKYATSKSILGICLGHQAIGEVFGCQLKNLEEVHHGVSHSIQVIKNEGLFLGLPNTFKVGRYHSWSIDGVSDDIIVTATDQKGLVMAFKHKSFDVQGVQFHPESVLTEYGQDILANWLGEL